MTRTSEPDTPAPQSKPTDSGGEGVWKVWAGIQAVQNEVHTVAATDSAEIVNNAGEHLRTYRYLNLVNLTAAIRKPMADAGLMYVQYSEPGPTPGSMDLRTRFVHVVAQSWVDLGLVIDRGADPQKTGGALTYARRYALGTILGIVVDKDDDGRAASPPTASREAVERVAGRLRALTDEQVIADAKEDMVNLGLPPVGQPQAWTVDHVTDAEKLVHRCEIKDAQAAPVQSADGPRSREEMVADARNESAATFQDADTRAELDTHGGDTAYQAEVRATRGGGR